jgi:hypothetical protein
VSADGTGALNARRIISSNFGRRDRSDLPIRTLDIFRLRHAGQLHEVVGLGHRLTDERRLLEDVFLAVVGSEGLALLPAASAWP